MSAPSASSYAEQFVRERLLLAEIGFENSSYLKVGGYDAKNEGKMRPSEVKGFMRWWYRVAAAVCAQNEDYLGIEKEHVIGILGGVGSSQAKGSTGQSLIRLVVESKSTEDAKELQSEKQGQTKEANDKIDNVIKRKIADSHKPHGLKTVIKVYLSRPYGAGFERKYGALGFDRARRVLAGVAALALGLIFEGVGASSSRGYAGVKLTDFKLHKQSLAAALTDKGEASRIEQYASNLEGKIREIMDAQDGSGLEKALEGLVKLTVELMGCAGGAKRGGAEDAPIVPTLDYPDLFKFFVLEAPQEQRELLKVIAQAFSNVRRSPGRDFFGKSALTRKSAIRATIFENKSKRFIILHGFFFIRKEGNDKEQDKKSKIIQEKSNFERSLKELSYQIRQKLGVSPMKDKL